jgi:uncharacterized membrane protein HdeD (DUF308 family)
MLFGVTEFFALLIYDTKPFTKNVIIFGCFAIFEGAIATIWYLKKEKGIINWRGVFLNGLPGLILGSLALIYLNKIIEIYTIGFVNVGLWIILNGIGDILTYENYPIDLPLVKRAVSGAQISIAGGVLLLIPYFSVIFIGFYAFIYGVFISNTAVALRDLTSNN